MTAVESIRRCYLSETSRSDEHAMFPSFFLSGTRTPTSSSWNLSDSVQRNLRQRATEQRIMFSTDICTKLSLADFWCLETRSRYAPTSDTIIQICNTHLQETDAANGEQRLSFPPNAQHSLSSTSTVCKSICASIQFGAICGIPTCTPKHAEEVLLCFSPLAFKHTLTYLSLFPKPPIQRETVQCFLSSNVLKRQLKVSNAEYQSAASYQTVFMVKNNT